MNESQFNASVSVSRRWDAEVAGSELANGLDQTRKPKFVLLFTTIHYEKNQGFKKILEKMYEKLEKDTPLIGGTVAGFMTKEGGFTRGVATIAIYSDSMDVAVGLGKNTKRNPKQAAVDCAKKIRDGLKNSQHPEEVVFEIVSGPTIPEFPIIKRKRVLNSNILGEIFAAFSGMFLQIFQNGVGREEEVLEKLAAELPGRKIIGGSTIDDNKLGSNYQFYFNHVLQNSLVAIGVKTTKKITLASTIGLSPTKHEFEATSIAGSERILKKLNNRGAKDEFLSKIGWPKEFLDERIYRRTFHYTLGSEINGTCIPDVIGAVYGETLWCGHKIKSKNIRVFTSSGKKLIESVQENIKAQVDSPDLYFVVSCASRLETLGGKIYAAKELIEEYVKDKPFFLAYFGGEAICEKGSCRHCNYSFNSFTIS